MAEPAPEDEKPAAHRGRPTEYSEETAIAICLRLAGGESLRAICRPDYMPAESTVRLWATTDRNGFAAQYARAREAQADCLAEEILEIADDSSADKVLHDSEDGPSVETVDHEHIARSRLRVDARKWFAAKVAPKRYGDRIAHVGPNDGPIDVVTVLLREIDGAGRALPKTED